MSDPFVVDEITVVREPTYVTIDNVTETLVIEGSPVVNAAIPPQQEICDLVSATEAYVGYSIPGSLTSESKWHICHVVDTSEGPVTTWARSDSGSLMNLVWDDRLSYEWP